MEFDKLKFFCALPFIGLAVSPNAKIHPCCMTTMFEFGNLNNGDLFSQYNSSMFKKLRLAILNNEIPKECYSCSNGEKTGGYSLRYGKNNGLKNYYKDIEAITNVQTGELSKLLIKDTDIRPSNICNFRCQMCSSTCSRGHAHAMDKQTKDCEELILSQINPLLDNIDTYHFAGGEPFLMNSTYEVMDHYIKTGNKKVNIGFSTNLSVIDHKGVCITEWLKKIKQNVTLNVSIDGYGKVCEEQRVGCNFDNLVNNLLKVRKDCPNIKINSHTVVTIINAEWIPEFMEWIMGFKYSNGMFTKNVINKCSFNCLTNPVRLNIIGMSMEKKVQIKNKYMEFIKKYEGVKIDGFNLPNTLNYIMKNMRIT